MFLNGNKVFSHDKLSQADELRLKKITQFIKKELISKSIPQVPCTDAKLLVQLHLGNIDIEAWVNEINRLYEYDSENCLKKITEFKQTDTETALITDYAKICFANEHGDNKTAIKAGLELLIKTRKYPILTAAIYHLLGRSYHSNIEYEVSFQNFEMAIKTAREINDIDTEVLAWVGLMGVSREIFQDDVAKVNVYTENVRKLLPLIKNPNIRILALVYMALFNQTDTTVAQLDRFEEISKTMTSNATFWAKNTFIMVFNDYIYGDDTYEKEYVLFLKYYAYSMSKMPASFNSNFNIGRSYLSLADYFQRKGKLNEAQAYMDSTFIFAGRSKIDALTYEIQSNIYESKGELPKAIEFIRKALKTYETDYINRNNEIAFRNERRFFTKEKELKLTLANKENKQKANLLWILSIGMSLLAILLGIVFWQNTKAKRANSLIKRQSEELVVLMKEAHHRVKNNLQMVSAILYLQANASKEKEAIDALLNAEGRLKTIALVHESLYKSENIAKINLNGYLLELANNLAKHATPSFDFSVNAQTELITNLDAAIPIGLIVNELITNSIKYAFKNQMKGYIEIILEKTDDNFNIVKYRDNGAGFLDGKLPDAKTSLGIRLIKIFVQQLKGTLEYDQANGVEFRLKFKNL